MRTLFFLSLYIFLISNSFANEANKVERKVSNRYLHCLMIANELIDKGIIKAEPGFGCTKVEPVQYNNISKTKNKKVHKLSPNSKLPIFDQDIDESKTIIFTPSRAF